LRRTVARRAATRFLRRVARCGLSTLCRAVFSAARLIAGVDRVSVARPAASAAPVFSSTTSVAAFAAAPMASPATAFMFLAPRFAAWTIVCLVFDVTVLTITWCLLHFDNAQDETEFQNGISVNPGGSGRRLLESFVYVPRPFQVARTTLGQWNACGRADTLCAHCGTGPRHSGMGQGPSRLRPLSDENLFQSSQMRGEDAYGHEPRITHYEFSNARHDRAHRKRARH